MYGVNKTARQFGLVCTAFLCLTAVLFTGCLSTAGIQTPDYSKASNWAYFAEGSNKPADVFLICPTVASGADGN